MRHYMVRNFFVHTKVYNNAKGHGGRKRIIEGQENYILAIQKIEI